MKKSASGFILSAKGPIFNFCCHSNHVIHLLPFAIIKQSCSEKISAAKTEANAHLFQYMIDLWILIFKNGNKTEDLIDCLHQALALKPSLDSVIRISQKPYNS